MSVRRRTLVPGVWVIALAGCADTAALGPDVRAGMTGPSLSTAYDGSVPYYTSQEQVPFEYWWPKIYSRSPVVYWSGTTAVASSHMLYYGNRAEENFMLAIDGPVSSISREGHSASIGGFLPDNYSHTTPGFTLTARGQCGHVANLNSSHTAKTVLFIELRGLTEVSVSVPDGDSATQPDCAGGEGCTAKRYDQADYDPYEEEACEGDDGGGNDGGTQYYPGDYTGGETVDWATGVGTGGTSACGDTAKVEYVCIDYWDGQQWVEWSCGYITTC